MAALRIYFSSVAQLEHRPVRLRDDPARRPARFSVRFRESLLLRFRFRTHGSLSWCTRGRTVRHAARPTIPAATRRSGYCRRYHPHTPLPRESRSQRRSQATITRRRCRSSFYLGPDMMVSGNKYSVSNAKNRAGFQIVRAHLVSVVRVVGRARRSRSNRHGRSNPPENAAVRTDPGCSLPVELSTEKLCCPTGRVA